MANKHSLLSRASVRIMACLAVFGGGAFYYAGDDKPDAQTQQLTGDYQLPADYDAHRQQQRSFSTTDGSIAYTDHGGRDGDESDVIVLLHGVPTSSWMYRKLIPHLQKHMRVVSVDLLGYGSSDKPKTPEGVYAPDKQAARVSALLAHLQIDQYSVLMHDMGGLVAWEMLRQQAPIANFIVLNTIVRKLGFNHPDFNKGSFTKMMMKTYSNSLSSSIMLRRTFEELGLDTTHPLSESECRGYVKPIEEGSDVALYEFFTSLKDALFNRLEANQSFFNDFEGRTLVLWGAKDSILTTEQIPFLQDHLRIDERDIHLFNDSNHFIAEEIPLPLAEHIVEFMQAD